MQVGAALAMVVESTFVVIATESIFICGAIALRLMCAIVCILDWIGKHEKAVDSCELHGRHHCTLGNGFLGQR